MVASVCHPSTLLLGWAVEVGALGREPWAG